MRLAQNFPVNLDFKFMDTEKGYLFFYSNKRMQRQTIELTRAMLHRFQSSTTSRALSHIGEYVAIRRDTLFYSAGNEIKIVATVAIRRIGGTCSTRAIETDGPD